MWASEHRSAETRSRADQASLVDTGTVEALAQRSDVILSIAPPYAAGDVARSVAGRTPLFVDANAISPATAESIGATLERAGGSFVDGGIIGPPPEKSGTTRLYLSGDQASDVAALFPAGPLEARVLSGSASALKMCYAAWTKGTTALLLTVLAAARNLGVDQELAVEWAISQSRALAEAPLRERLQPKEAGASQARYAR